MELEQWEIRTYEKEWKDLKYELERYNDFFDWLEENHLDQSIGELFVEFEKWEEEQDEEKNDIAQ